MDASRWTFPPFSFMKNLTTKEKSGLYSISQKRIFSKGNYVFQAKANQLNDSVYVLLSGRVKLFRLAPGGKESIQWLCMSGEIFGLSEDNHSPYLGLNAQSLTSSEILCISRKDFNQYLLDHPQLALLVISQLTQRIRTLGDMLLNLASDDVMSRLTKVLTRLCYQHGKLNGDNIILDIPLTQQEIADMIGSSRQTVNSSLSELRKQGYLKIENQCIHIMDSNILSKYLQHNANENKQDKGVSALNEICLPLGEQQ